MYGDCVYGMSRFLSCWKISIVVPFVSTTSAPLFAFARDSLTKRAETSSDDAR